jgi:hypothetical protein
MTTSKKTVTKELFEKRIKHIRKVATKMYDDLCKNKKVEKRYEKYVSIKFFKLILKQVINETNNKEIVNKLQRKVCN